MRELGNNSITLSFNHSFIITLLHREHGGDTEENDYVFFSLCSLCNQFGRGRENVSVGKSLRRMGNTAYGPWPHAMWEKFHSFELLIKLLKID
jgi:hypothetical protein